MSEYSEWSKTSRNMIFSWRPDVCVCVCVCARLYNFQTTIIHKRREISSWNLAQQWSSHALQSWQSSCKLTPNLRFYEISNFLKNDCGSKQSFAHKYNTSINDLWYWIWPKLIGTVKFLEFMHFLKIFSNKLCNLSKLRVIKLKIWVWMLSDVWY